MDTDLMQDEGGYYDTEEGYRIFRAKSNGEVVTFDTEIGEITMNLWWGAIVGGASRVMVQDLDIGPDWTELRRG